MLSLDKNFDNNDRLMEEGRIRIVQDLCVGIVTLSVKGIGLSLLNYKEKR